MFFQIASVFLHFHKYFFVFKKTVFSTLISPRHVAVFAAATASNWRSAAADSEAEAKAQDRQTKANATAAAA